MPVIVWIGRDLRFTAFALTLRFDPDVLEQPEAEDVTVAVRGQVKVDGKRRGRLEVEFAASSNLHVPGGQPLMTVSFDVRESPAKASSPVILGDMRFMDERRRPITLRVGRPGRFCVIPEIVPPTASVSVGKRIQFTATVGDRARWRLLQSESNGWIDAETGLYRAGRGTGRDVVEASVDGAKAWAEVTVTK